METGEDNTAVSFLSKLSQDYHFAKYISFLPAAKPTSHRTVRVVVVGGELL